jgi:hypothetical protein
MTQRIIAQVTRLMRVEFVHCLFLCYSCIIMSFSLVLILIKFSLQLFSLLVNSTLAFRASGSLTVLLNPFWCTNYFLTTFMCVSTIF